MKQLFVLAMLLTVAGCGYEDSRMAHQAQINMVGMTAADLQACAGVPDKTRKIDDRTEIFTYMLKNDATSGSTCSAHVRIDDNRVAAFSTAATAIRRSARTAPVRRSSAAACGGRNRAWCP